MYTTPPDEHFVIGPHPSELRVLLCSACSGHGYKFAPVVGEVVAELTRIARSALLVSIVPAGLMQTRPPPGKAGSGPPTQLRCARKPASRLTCGQRDAG